MIDEDLRRTLAGALPDLDAVVRTLEQSPRGTIRPNGGADTAPRHPAIEALGSSLRPHLTFDGVLGEGGMGCVRLATQISLGRKVAVKSLRPEAKRPEAVFRLLHEAWITGSLEHPNVVPIHDMCLDAAGEPLIVLKRIEGQAWSELMFRPDELRRRFDADEPLAWNLRILMQICTTVAFAHSRGVIHRDLKPENVMVGAYGEVYLLDWGIAVSLREDPTGRLPLARDVREMAGTPIYMAPEMLGQRGAVLSERTDVYLLGAILFEILAGRAPHQGQGVMDILMNVVRSAPEFPRDAPPELVVLCRQAMAPDPEDRLASPEALRQGLQDWLTHRPSMLLTSQAERAMAELTVLLGRDAEASEATDAAEPADAAELADERRRLRYKLLGECRFGFRQALSIWPENRRAADGLRRVVRAMIDHELGQGDHRAAAALLSELSPPSPEVERAVEALRRRNAEEAARIASAQTVADAHDLRIGVRTRRFFMLILGLAWAVLPLTWALVGPATMSWWEVAGSPALFLLIAGGLSYWARETMTRTVVNRRIVATLLLTCGALLFTDLSFWLAGLSPDEAMRTHPLTLTVIVSMGVITIDARFWPTSLVCAVATLIGIVWPGLIFHAVGLLNLALGINGLAVWREAEPTTPTRGAARDGLRGRRPRGTRAGVGRRTTP